MAAARRIRSVTARASGAMHIGATAIAKSGMLRTAITDIAKRVNAISRSLHGTLRRAQTATSSAKSGITTNQNCTIG